MQRPTCFSKRVKKKEQSRLIAIHVAEIFHTIEQAETPDKHELSKIDKLMGHSRDLQRTLNELWLK